MNFVTLSCNYVTHTDNINLIFVLVCVSLHNRSRIKCETVFNDLFFEVMYR